MLRPVVLHPVTLPEFLRHLIDHHAAPTSLVVCSSRDAFERHLLHCVESGKSVTLDGPKDEQHSSTLPSTIVDELLVPTLRNLASTSTIRLTFCASLESLRAYLSMLATTPLESIPGQRERTDDTIPMLALVNPIALHKETTSYSAQGLSRTLAIAVEAAAHRGQRLTVAECPVPSHLCERRHTDWEEEEGEFGLEAAGAAPDTEQGARARTREAEMLDEEDAWAEKLSILNTTTKSFGLGDRAWLGRTVSARQVAERWCRFESAQ